jgi:hypothetical protein
MRRSDALMYHRGLKKSLLRILSLVPCAHVASCATVVPIVEAPCRGEGGCGHAGVQARVIDAFDALEVLSVIECVNEPSTSCFSTDPDEDACLVLVQPGAVEAFASRQNGKPTQLLPSRPTSVLYFSRWLEKRFSRVFSDKPTQSQSERMIYTESEDSLAVLVLAEERCFNVDEVAATYR